MTHPHCLLSACSLLSAYSVTVFSYKRICLTTSVYGSGYSLLCLSEYFTVHVLVVCRGDVPIGLIMLFLYFYNRFHQFSDSIDEIRTILANYLFEFPCNIDLWLMCVKLLFHIFSFSLHNFYSSLLALSVWKWDWETFDRYGYEAVCLYIHHVVNALLLCYYRQDGCSVKHLKVFLTARNSGAKYRYNNYDLMIRSIVTCCQLIGLPVCMMINLGSGHY